MCSNCTLLELKPKFKRHFPLPKQFKLYLTGIETGDDVPDDASFSQFKLYLTGIETDNAATLTLRLLRSNCTLLELKLRFQYCIKRELLQFKLYLTGIETISDNYECRKYYGSNCTLLELKRLFCLLRNQDFTVQIVPYWNWNSRENSISTMTWCVQIVPYWNWNVGLT